MTQNALSERNHKHLLWIYENIKIMDAFLFFFKTDHIPKVMKQNSEKKTHPCEFCGSFYSFKSHLKSHEELTLERNHFVVRFVHQVSQTVQIWKGTWGHTEEKPFLVESAICIFQLFRFESTYVNTHTYRRSVFSSSLGLEKCKNTYWRAAF